MKTQNNKVEITTTTMPVACYVLENELVSLMLHKRQLGLTNAVPIADALEQLHHHYFNQATLHLSDEQVLLFTDALAWAQESLDDEEPFKAPFSQQACDELKAELARHEKI